ncbi:hypothetical protein LTR35_005359 [Friedmanniomyces endolithicus]|uniref:DUF4045 domain-containing protein n=1 Tax=Friedmanniomyces endolithicus TaxID=329885 RepID=A0AAN6G1N5_9PEZI|nr:hypothetical protein LTR35_005359 [Friedmanniomyces endolithicus]KAK0299440.1 hypothetical protein LTS00_001883 [Friedmanniomyces endolithicus]KAK0326934.1 hypothetical protein LTR82_001694 [Friedmanniomyces endolithicus]KAK1019232.1 hypothetical protein LTR54_001047 [Friedmanniomyces endolithicus]
MDPSIETSAPPYDNEDLDPAKFLKSIRELSERREREDLERFRKLEAEVEKSRAERARKKVEAVGAGATPAHVYSPGGVNQQQRSTPSRPSILPVKAHSAHEIHSPTSARNESLIHTRPQPQPLSPSIAPLDPAMEVNGAGPPSPTKDIPEFKGFSSGRASNTPSAPTSAQSTDPASSRPSPSASSLARSGTLSWQQRRPQSRGASRPASVVGGEDSGHARNASRASRPTSGVGSEDSGHARNASLDQPEPSRDQIAASLGSRDPAWFRRTAERGTGSAAYRKSKDEASAGQSVASSKRVLPGLARDTPTEPSRQASPAPAENFRSEIASTPSSARDSGIASSRVSATPSNSTLNKADLKSLLAEDEAQRQASPMSDHASSTGTGQHTELSRNLSMSSSQARLANAAERPSSSTKGMGGFVQSAMMKRSDSVSKRWSAQPGASLSRQNSTVSTRSGYNGLQGSRSMPRLEPTPSSREASNEPVSRPTSSSSNLTALTQHRDGDDVFVKPALPHHSRSKSVASTYGTTVDDNAAAASPPSSPSKRFSPTKSSWIESALTKPESPKPSTARNAQPGWMANIAKAKAERASAESTPRTGTPRPAGEQGSRPASPVKSASAPFGPSLLRSASSRSLAGAVRSSTPPLMRTPVAGPREGSAVDEPTSSRVDEREESGGMKASVPEVQPTPTRVLDDTKTSTAHSEQIPERRPDATKTRTAPDSEDHEYGPRPITLEPRPADAKPALELPSSRSFISPTPSTPTKAKPEVLAKPKPETQPVSKQPLESAQTRTAPRPENRESSTRSATLPPGPVAAKPALDLPSSRSIISSSQSTPSAQSKPEVLTKVKPETPAKPQTDFRNTLRSRPAGETKSQGTPEFLSRFGQLRKTQPEKYIAPDILRDNITRGKADLARTGGPVKTPRRDELKESLLAKKEDWKKAKEEGRELPGQVHERKTSAGVPVTPPKPEALAKREWLGRSGDGGRAAGSPEKGREATPEALTRQRTLREEVKAEPAQAKPPTIASHDHATSEPLSKQQSAPAVIEHIPAPATAESSSRLAARFNPGLAGLLARGPPSANTSNAPSRSGSPGVPQRATTLPSGEGASEMAMEGSSEGPLKDMRKGRARGPKKRRGGGEAGAGVGAGAEDVGADEAVMAAPESAVKEQGEAPLSVPAVKPRAPPGSMAALMAASLAKAAEPQSAGRASDKSAMPAEPITAFAKPEEREGRKPATPAKPSSAFVKQEQREAQMPATPAKSSSAFAKPKEREVQKPATPAKSLAFSMKPSRAVQEPPKSDVAKPSRTTHEPAESNVPIFSGFASKNRAPPTPKPEDNKENSDETLPSVKSAASFWGRQPSPKKVDAPPQILLPSQRDEEAAMRSAGLLASSHSGASSSNGSSNGLGISVEKRNGGSQATPPGSAGLPPKPMRSSRTVSGQLMEASVNKGASRLMPTARPSTDAEKLLARTFGVVPTSDVPLMIDTRALMSEEQGRPATEVKTLRRTTQEILPDGSVIALRQQEQYTLFDSSVYICTHTYLTATSTKQTQLFIWSGNAASLSALSHAQTAAKKVPRDSSTLLPLQPINQGHEPATFLQALGGILITRRGAPLRAAKQYILCGRQHLGHVVFDEVDFGLASLCAGFVFLISYPVTLQRTDLYLWKGSACAMEEVCAARLVGMEISEMGGIVEVEQGGEGPGFLGTFGPETVKEGIPGSSAVWEGKAGAPERFEVCLYRVEEVVQKVSLFAGLLSRRPSWNSRPLPSSRSASQDGAEIKVEAKRISPFTQTDLEAEGIYVLVAYSELYILIGPLFASTPERVRDVLLAQSLRFAATLDGFRADDEGWEGRGRGIVVFGGVPRDVKMLFRCWDEGRGLWGTGGLMAGSRGTRGDEVMMVGLDEVVRAVCR